MLFAHRGTRLVAYFVAGVVSGFLVGLPDALGVPLDSE